MIDKFLLFPYYWVLKARNRRWSRPGRKFSYAEVPTLCIGNVTVGGTGKTPHVEMVLRLLQQHPDWCDKQLAVLSRGYKRDSKGFQQVTAEGSAVLYGDEPMQIKKKFPDVVVAVDKKREQGCDLLVHPEKLKGRRWEKRCWNREFKPADYIVLDDAFQYRRLKTHKSVVLVDYNRPVQKDMLLPLGRLRDLPERIYDADALIVTKCQGAPPADLLHFRALRPGGRGISNGRAALCLLQESHPRDGHRVGQAASLLSERHVQDLRALPLPGPPPLRVEGYLAHPGCREQAAHGRRHHDGEGRPAPAGLHRNATGAHRAPVQSPNLRGIPDGRGADNLY